MIEVLVEFGWNYVSVVHTEGDYGYEGPSRGHSSGHV